jgi:hypothetical protein
MNTGLSASSRVNEPFTNRPKGGGRSQAAIARPAPENRAPRSCMTGALHRERGSRARPRRGLAGYRALLSSSGVWGLGGFGRPFHTCQLSRVGGQRYGR